MSLDTAYERLTLELAEPFTIARGTTTETENVVVRVSDGDHVGLGAAAPAEHYGETPDTVEAVLPRLLSVVERVDDPHAIQRVVREMDREVQVNPAAKAAVDVALHDLAAKRLDAPLYRMLGLDGDDAVTSSFTVGIAETDRMREKAREAVADGYEVLKVKLGTGRDREILTAVREGAPDARLRVDANEAWGVSEAVEMIDACADHGVEFVEQPVPAEHPEQFRRVRERSALPLAADESCVRPDDVPAAAEVADIANLKLMKCGGLWKARRMAGAARAHGMDVMLGCMIETNVAIAAAAHLAPLLDHADLDGSLLLEADPYDGVPMPGGRIDLSGVERGTGVREA